MKRIQRKRSRGFKMPENSKYVGRPTRWGNPYWVEGTNVLAKNVIGQTYVHAPHKDRQSAIESAIDFYKYWLEGKLLDDPRFLDELFGFDSLACWCSLDAPCHVDMILRKIVLLKQLDAVLDEAVKNLASNRVQMKDVMLEIPIDRNLNYMGFGNGELIRVDYERKVKLVYYKSEKVVAKILSSGRISQEELNRKFVQFKQDNLE